MAPVEFQPVFKPTQQRTRHGFDFITVRIVPFPVSEISIANKEIQSIVKDSFKVSTFMLFGAIAQIILFVVLPTRWAIVPTAILALNAVLTTIFQLLRPASSAYMSHVIPDVVSAQLPSSATGRFGPKPAAEQVVVFHIGAQYNHPLGPLAPGASDVNKRFAKMAVDISKRANEYGMLGLSGWRGGERGSNNTGMTVIYFRNIEGLNKFAQDPMHREAWEWWNRFKDDYPHIGIFHETFVALPGAWETIYHHIRPVLMGATSMKCKTEEGEAWVNSLVNAENTTLRGQYGRMGRRNQQEA
jgi:hypothetical protein